MNWKDILKRNPKNRFLDRRSMTGLRIDRLPTSPQHPHMLRDKELKEKEEEEEKKKLEEGKRLQTEDEYTGRTGFLDKDIFPKRKNDKNPPNPFKKK